LAGREEPWRDWLERHGSALVLYARQHCASYADAEDAVQDGFVRFWKSRSHARDCVAYLYACVRSAAMDLSRGKARRQKHELAAVREPALLSASEENELREMVEAAMIHLPHEQREVLIMKVWGGLTFAQIAEALSISANTAASRYRYALERLETMLAREVNHG
jgi:RNA polymerase sigma-70 factor (ECF subfamily)